MQLEHSFTVPVGVDEAWDVLLDIERIAPCMPGATVDSVDGDDFTATVKVKLGPIAMTYKVKARFVSKDVATHRVVIEGRGRDSRGNGTANATVTATLTQEGAHTKVEVLTDLDVTGKPAQFGRGVMVDVGNKLIGQFSSALADQLASGSDDTTAAAAAAAGADSPTPDDAMTALTTADPSAGTEPSGATVTNDGTAAAAKSATAARTIPPREVEPINLLDSAGSAVAKRLAAPVGVLALLIAVFVVWRRRSR